MYLTHVLFHIVLVKNKHNKLFVIYQVCSQKVQIYAYNASKYVWRPGSAWTRWGGANVLPHIPSRN